MIATIGLEVHVQLLTRTKIFCPCAVEFGSPPNKNVCPVCLGLPGALPVLNQAVFALGLKAVLALGGEPAQLVKFDRKNYFYPDLPKGYQISQFSHPLGARGGIEILRAGQTVKINLNRLHLEEDAGKLLHDQLPDSSVVDLNRAGTPLAEIVSEPELESADEAYEYLTNLKAILRSIGVSECDMEKGQLRCDANVSVRKNSSEPLGKKVEVKNLNSFKAVKAAIQHEIARQTEALEKGEKLSQETRLWDDNRQKTFTMRSKEEAHDYRYFPEPDLVPFTVNKADVEKMRSTLSELPKAKLGRFVESYKLSEYEAKLITADPEIAGFFEECMKLYENPKTIVAWITGAVFAYRTEHAAGLANLTPSLLIDLQKLVDTGALSLQTAKEKVFPEVIRDGKAPGIILKEKGLQQVSDDSSLGQWISEAIQANPKVVADFKSGKETAAMFLVGQVMKKSQGKANPGKVKELMVKKLAEA